MRFFKVRHLQINLSLFSLFMGGVLFSLSEAAFAAPSSLTYQGRILKADGSPLEYNNVGFTFAITDPTGQCIVYLETVSGLDMSNSGGVFDTAIGNGTRTFPAGAISFTVLDSLNNSGILGCQGGSSYTPSTDDGRKLRVQFYDGTGWKLVSPDNVIRSVPYAGYAASSARLGDHLPTDFILKTGLPTCGAGTFLSWNGTALSCTGVVGAAGGTVTDVTSTNAYLSVANSSSTPALTLNVGTIAGTVAAGNDSRITGALQTGAAAGGDLSGTYPNPTVAKLQNVAISASAPTSGRFLKYNGTNWADTAIAISDVTSLSTALAGKPDYTQFPVCTAAQSLTFISPVGGFSCTAIAIAGSQVTGNITGNAAGFTGALVGDVSGTQGATSVDKIKGTAVTITTITSGDYLKYNGTAWVNSPLSVSGSSFGSQAANQVLASPDGTTGNPSFRSLVAADLPTSVTNGLWTAASGDVYRTSGKVGIGTNAPGVSLDIGTKTDAVALPSGTTAQRPGSPVNGYTRYNTDMKGLEAYINGSWQQVSAGTSPTASEDGKTLRWNNTTKQFDWFTAGAAGAGIATLNGSSQSSQSFVTGTSGTDFGISTNTGTGVHTFNIPTASATNRGALSSTDWTTFNGKQVAGNYVTALTGDVTAAGPGSAAASVDKIKGVALDMTGIASGNFLKYNGTAWVPSALPTGNAGTVTDVSSTNSYLSVANGTNAAALTLNVGAVANSVAAGDDTRIVNAIQNAGGAVSIQSGLDAAKGSPSLNGRIYIATDTQKIYRDNGSALVVVASTGAGGTVTSVTGSGPISVATGTTTPVISISQAGASADGYLTSGDWNIFNTKLSAVTNTANLANTKIWIGDAGGKAQEFPFTGNVSLTAGGVTKVTAIQNIPVSATAPTADGQVLRNVSGTWTPGFISMFDLRSTVTGSATFGSGAAGCTASQTLTWTSATDNLACTTIAIADSQVTYGTKTANTVLAGPTSGGAAVPTFRALVAADLPAGIASQWQNNSSDIYFSGGNVGIGTTIPGSPLDVNGTIRATAICDRTGANCQTLASGWATGTVTGVTATAPVMSSGGTAPVISMAPATTSANGYLTSADWNTFSGKAPLASPTFTGTPAAPTAAVNTNTTQLATTAFVLGQASSTTPLINGTAAIGTSYTYARADHVHPTDTSRAPAAGSTSVITLGTVTTGTWNGSIIPVAYGGTGTATGSITGTSALTFTAGGSNQNVTLTPSGTGYTILNGNVGIGTVAPGRLLEVAAASTNTTVISSSTASAAIANTDTTANNTSDLVFRTNDASGTMTTDSKIVGVHISHTASAVSGELAFTTTNAGTSGERLRIDKSGNVGIGTTVPGAQLDVNGNAKFRGGINASVRVITAAGAVTVTTSDYIICVNKTVGAATSVNLPASPAVGDQYIIKDCKGDANTNNITLVPASGNIDGAASFVISIARQSIGIFYDGTQWQAF